MKPRYHVLAIVALATCALARSAHAQQPAGPPPISRTELMRQVLPPGNYRNVQAAVVELAPGAAAALHRHDVGVLAYVLEGAIENRFGDGPVAVHRAGESWWEPPGTVHRVARNPSTTARTRFLVVYVGEEGKANTVPLDTTRR